MTLPILGKWSDEKVLDQTADRLARLAMMAADTTTHGDPFYAFNKNIGFPTRPNTEALLRTALAAVDEARPLVSGRGLSLKYLFAQTWERIDADPGDDETAKELLVDFYARVEPPEPWEGTRVQVQRVVDQLASSDEGTLWTLAVQAAYPDHPQTPGSAKWNEAEASGGPHESQGNPFAGR